MENAETLLGNQKVVIEHVLSIYRKAEEVAAINDKPSTSSKPSLKIELPPEKHIVLITSSTSTVTCPACNHDLGVGLLTHEDLIARNAAADQKHRAKLAAWEAGDQKTRKPGATGEGKQHAMPFGCMCASNNCGGNPNGSGCFTCAQSGPFKSSWGGHVFVQHLPVPVPPIVALGHGAGNCYLGCPQKAKWRPAT